jgi:hypothetical protein
MSSASVQDDARARGSKSTKATFLQIHRSTQTEPARLVTSSDRPTVCPPDCLSSWIGRPDVELAHHRTIGQTDSVDYGRGDVLRLQDFLRLAFEHGLILHHACGN